MKKKFELNLGKWKDYRVIALNEDVERHHHEGNHITSRDIYDKIQEFGAFNKDLPVEVIDIEKVFEPGEQGKYTITNIKIQNGKLIIEII